MLDADTKRRVRGWILQVLARTSPSADGIPPTPIDLLARYLRNAQVPVTKEDVERELRYLEGKKLVELVVPRGKFLAIAGGISARITSLGSDVVDGTIVDPGIDRGPEFE